jgi:hypothetical protein
MVVADKEQAYCQRFDLKCNWLGRSRFGQKRSILGHSSPFFSSDALHRTQKSGLIDLKSPTFLIQNR